MDEPLFIGPKLKIKRANKHIQDLNSVISTFLRTDFYRLVSDKDGFATRFRVESNPIPEDVPLIVGDAIHNLRSALDLMHCEIITMSGGKPTRHDAFRIMEKRHELVGALNGGEIKRAGPTIIDLIVDTVRPYREVGGNDAVCALHDLDITDKHHLIVSVIGTVGPFSLDVHTKTSDGTVYTNRLSWSLESLRHWSKRFSPTPKIAAVVTAKLAVYA